MTLSDRLLNWIIQSTDDTAIVQSIVRLKGSTSSILHHVGLLIGADILNVVVREFNHEAWLQEEPDLVIHEANSLRLAEKTDVPTPTLIAYDETGEECGVPAILMTKVDGQVNLKPSHFDQWTSQLAHHLVSLHSISADHFSWTYFTYNDIQTWKQPKWSKYPHVWQELLKVAKGPASKVKHCFIHRDYHPANVLWQNGKISGVVDWVNACLGPAGVDVGHCRVNMAMLYDVQTADLFLHAYMKQAGRNFSYEPYWDIIALIDILFGPPTVYPGWAAFGVTGLTDSMMAERLDMYAKSLYERLK